MKVFVRIVCALAVLLMVPGYFGVSAQRRVNPVKSASGELQGKNENRQEGDSIDFSKLAHYHDDKGNVVYVDTVAGTEVVDSTNLNTGKIPKMIQPLFYAAAVGVDVWDPLMRVFGQHYGLVEFSAELNLHNRYVPVVEFGLGATDYTPQDNNYTFKVPVTPYFRIGCNYNFIYNSNPDYMAFAGLRFGWSRFGYDIDDVRLNSDYWDETATFNVPRQICSVSYLQVLFGIRVKVLGPVSMGWNIRYKAKLHESKAAYGEPWYIPGYGSRNGAITGSFSIIYTIPLKKKEISNNNLIEEDDSTMQLSLIHI